MIPHSDLDLRLILSTMGKSNAAGMLGASGAGALTLAAGHRGITLISFSDVFCVAYGSLSQPINCNLFYQHYSSWRTCQQE